MYFKRRRDPCQVSRDNPFLSTASLIFFLTVQFYRVCSLLKQGTYHEKVVPVVCGLVSDASQPVRVRGHAAAAIVNFTDTDGVPEEAVTPHLDSLLSALCSCLNGGVPQSVQVCTPYWRWGVYASPECVVALRVILV